MISKRLQTPFFSFPEEINLQKNPPPYGAADLNKELPCGSITCGEA